MFSLIDNTKLTKIKKCYFENRVDKMQKYLATQFGISQKHINDIEWLFATTTVKSANRIN